MTLREKIGQMIQVNSSTDENKELIRSGMVGSVLNEVDPGKVIELQRLSIEETRLGIPLIIARDVIHGFRTIFPIPLAQAATWNPESVEKAARTAAREASAVGVRWTFSPMVDISRDPRWGRIAESAGEDPVLTSAMGVAMVKGYQGDDLSRPDSVAACAKHFVAYGATEGGRDYNTTDISERTLRDIYLRPFQACVDAGVATFMSAFNEIDGVPASGNAFTLRQVLRDEWKFDGFVVSDWSSIQEMIVHGFCADDRHAAREGALAGVNMDMVSPCYLHHLADLCEAGEVPVACIDQAVREILRVKFRLGLFDHDLLELPRRDQEPTSGDRELARQIARESCVLLKNQDALLPLRKDLGSVAIIGPLADSPADQIGCWAFDRVLEDVVTPLAAIRDAVSPSTKIQFVQALANAAGEDAGESFDDAVRAASEAEATILFLGESEKLSGEAHCRAFLDLPAPQEALLKAVCATGKPVVVVLMAGRPLTMPWLATHANALLLAWHPGTLGGPAIADLLFGDHAPSGKLPVTIPRTVGQVPIYYNHKNSGRPAIESVRNLPMGTPLDPVGFCSGYLDVDPTPHFPFGFGLSYSTIEYGPTRGELEGTTFRISAEITNTGSRSICEVVQLYVRDLVGSVARPVKELKAFRRVEIAAGESRTVEFFLQSPELAFHGRNLEFGVEPGDFQFWIAGNSDGGTPIRLKLL